jgi:excisionase family DNA binding protein
MNIEGEWGEEGKYGENAGRKTGKKSEELESGEVYKGDVDLKLKESSREPKGTWSSSLIFENLTWLTASEAAVYLRLPSVGALRVLVFKRRLPFYRMGRNLRFKKAELDRLLDLSKNGGI